MSQTRFRRLLPKLADGVVESKASAALNRYRTVEMEIETSFTNDLTFLANQRPNWESLVVRSWNGEGLNTPDIDLLSQIHHLNAIEVPYIAPRAFNQLNRIDGLESFHLTSGGDFGNHLASLEFKGPISLQYLSIENTYGIQGKCHIFESHLPLLVSLDLSHTDITDADLEHIANLQFLESLYLHGTKITPCGIDLLSSSASLKGVFASETEIRPHHFEDLPFRLLLE